jgi:uncharacterized membrane protein
MGIDANAPLTAHKKILIDAPIERVWALQTSIESWPRWQPNVTDVSLSGPVAVGTEFRWKAKGVSITSRIKEMKQKQHICWTGDSFGMHAIHLWRFETVAGQTRVTMEESLSGWRAQLKKLIDARFLEKALEASLRLLKGRAERA